MWKKVCIIIFLLLCMCSIIPLVNSALSAAAPLGGTVTGRIGKLQKGDVVNLHTTFTPNSTGYGTSGSTNLSMKLIKSGLSNGNETYYNQTTYNSDTWFCGGMESLGTTSAFDPALHSSDFITLHPTIKGPDGAYARVGHVQNRFSNSKMAPYYNALVNAYQGNGGYDNEIVKPRIFKTIVSSQPSNLNPTAYVYQQDTAFPTFFALQGYERYQIINATNADLEWPVNYWLEMIYDSINKKWSYASAAGATSGMMMPMTSSAAMRPFVYLDLSNAVFAVSKPAASGGSAVISPSNNSAKAMNVRLYDAAMSVDFEKITTDVNGTDTNISGIQKGNDIKVFYQNAASTVNSYISVLFTDSSSGELKYYQQLGRPAGGQGSFTISTSAIPSGSYQVQLVNEEDYSDEGPRHSSALSSAISLQISDPLTISAAAMPNLKYQTNVFQNNIVATYTTANGVAPIQATLVSDTTVSGHSNDYQYFSLSNGNVTVNSANGLNAGDYYFKINAVDVNNDPTGGVNSSTVHVIVAKANLSVAFDNQPTTKISIAGATVPWNETATVTPNTGTKVKYEVIGGDTYLIDIDEDTGEITYKGGGAFGKVTIRATADDDPATGNDNYNPKDTDKEIVIYQEVDGTVTPDSNSSDHTIPTFTASDTNVKANGSIAKIRGTMGTPDTIGGSTTTYSYGIKPGVGDANFFSVDPNNGDIKATANLGVQSYHIVVTVSDNWSTKEIPVTVIVRVADAEDLKFYENSGSNTVITTKSAKATDTGIIVYATVKGSTNNKPVKYRIKDGSTNVIEVHPDSGAVTIYGIGTVTIVAEKQGANGQSDASCELEFTVTPGDQNFIYTDAGGNELPKTSGKYHAIEEVYQRNGTFPLYTSGNPPGSIVTYRLKAGCPTDVLSVDANSGEVSILNASLNTQLGKVIVEAVSHDPSGNYNDAIIEVPINIKKADHTISFADITYAISGRGTVTPIINEQDLSSNEGGVTINDTDYYITIDPSIASAIAWTTNGVDIEYDFDGAGGLTIPLHVEKTGNRNYNKAEATGSMRIMGPDESTLAINRPGKIIYGDHFEIRSLQDDSNSTNVQYQFEVDNTIYISNPTISGNKAEFDALKFSGNTNINIKVTRTADGETPLSKTVSVQVLPKPIEIIIDDKEKLKGEQNPPLTYQDFRNQLVSWNGVQDMIQENDIKLSTTARTDSNAGSYPIKGDKNFLNATYLNYSFTFKEGTLTIKEENIEDDWYHLEVEDGNNTAYSGEWTNKDVTIISDHHEYVNLSLDQSSWNPTKVTVSKEGETNQGFWMKKDSGAITKEKQEIIRIDKTAPKVKGIKAKDTNNKLQDIINKLSGGIFFKPGTAFEITTSDSKDDLKVSGTKEISYKVYQITDGIETEIKNGSLTVINEKASVTISETTGTYKVCVIPTDNAGNTNSESCHEVTLKKIDVDVDKDGKPDFNDPDGDGCPDLNIKWKDPNDETKWIIINGDRDYDGIPDLNIDSDGDGKADLNIDTDNDGKPDLNLVILKKSDWKPTKCVKADIDSGILEEYCTGTGVKAVINIDTDNDGIPNLNIDHNGDMKADYNIDINGDGIADMNIGPELTVWLPKQNYKADKFLYDSIGKDEVKPELNIDTDSDGLADINLDLNGDGIPELNVDTDGDYIPDIDIDSTGDGKPDINVDTDGDSKPDEHIVEVKEWKPEKNIDGEFPYDTMKINDKEEPKDPDNQSDDPNTSVKGSYNPATSMGGANTGDTTDMMSYIGLSNIALGTVLYMIYKRKKNA